MSRLRDSQRAPPPGGRIHLNQSAALRLLAAANDDAVLAAWAAVFDEHKMAPECDISPYDCWEVLQEFLSSGIVSPLEYDSVNLKASFFSGGRPSTGAIQGVLGRLAYLRANHPIDKENPMSNARPPMSAFSNPSALSTREESRSIDAPMSRGGIGAARPNPGLTAFNPRQESFSDPGSFRPIAEPPIAKAFNNKREADSLGCRKVDASLYRGIGEFDVQMLCCNQPMTLEDISEDEPYEGELEDGTDGILHEYMFHCQCQSCGARFHTSMARKIPEPGY